MLGIPVGQRWFPEKPGFEMLDDKMQAGYEQMQAKDHFGACRFWLKAGETDKGRSGFAKQGLDTTSILGFSL